MKNSVIIKGNRYGISIVLDKDLEFPILLKDLEKRLENAEEFFDSDKQLAVAFEGRTLTNEELDQILCVIQENSRLNIQYVMDENSELETTFFDIIQMSKEAEKTKNSQAEPIEISGVLGGTLPEESFENDLPHNTDNQNSSEMFYKGTLRSGQTLEAKNSLVMIGDVNPGATVIAGGNVVVIGSLKGNVIAGANGNTNAFVMALSMNPIQIQIGNIIARSSDVKEKNNSKQDSMIATVIDNQICMESVSKTAIHDIKL